LQTFSVAGHSGDRTCRKSPAVDQGHEDPQGLQGDAYFIASSGAKTPSPYPPPPPQLQDKVLCQEAKPPC
jgi:hypothetical protein